MMGTFGVVFARRSPCVLCCDALLTPPPTPPSPALLMFELDKSRAATVRMDVGYESAERDQWAGGLQSTTRINKTESNRNPGYEQAGLHFRWDELLRRVKYRGVSCTEHPACISSGNSYKERSI
uniref:Uncharacterized protein n=1 Tax=Octactis speculum TaxID=3111310 RepID=A0A7S2BIP8_9STRA